MGGLTVPHWHSRVPAFDCKNYELAMKGQGHKNGENDRSKTLLQRQGVRYRQSILCKVSQRTLLSLKNRSSVRKLTVNQA